MKSYFVSLLLSLLHADLYLNILGLILSFVSPWIEKKTTATGVWLLHLCTPRSNKQFL